MDSSPYGGEAVGPGHHETNCKICQIPKFIRTTPCHPHLVPPRLSAFPGNWYRDDPLYGKSQSYGINVLTKVCNKCPRAYLFLRTYRPNGITTLMKTNNCNKCLCRYFKSVTVLMLVLPSPRHRRATAAAAAVTYRRGRIFQKSLKFHNSAQNDARDAKFFFELKLNS